MAAIPLGKLTLVIGAGLVGSVLSTQGGIWDIKDFVSGAFKIVTKNLHQGKDKSPSTGKPQSDSLLAQVNNLREELQLLASSRSVTIVTGRSGSRTYPVAAIIVVGAVGYGYIWWKGWKLSDMMFVTRRGFSDACNSVGKDVDGLASSIATTKRHVGSRIDQTENSIDEVTALNTCTKNEVSMLNGEMREIREKTDIVYGVVHTLESRLVQIDNNQDVNNQGVVLLCDFVHQNLEHSKNAERIQSSQSHSPCQAIEHEQTAGVSRTISVPPLALESPSPSASADSSPKVLRPSIVSSTGLKSSQSRSPRQAIEHEQNAGVSRTIYVPPLALEAPSASADSSPKVLRPSVVSSTGLKELQEVSSEIKAWKSRRSSGISSGTPSVEEPSSTASSSSRFWSMLSRARSTVS